MVIIKQIKIMVKNHNRCVYKKYLFFFNKGNEFFIEGESMILEKKCKRHFKFWPFIGFVLLLPHHWKAKQMCAPHCQVGDLKRRNVNEKFLAYFFFHIAKPIFVILCYNCLSLKTVASHFKNYYQNFKYLSVEGFFLKILVC